MHGRNSFWVYALFLVHFFSLCFYSNGTAQTVDFSADKLAGCAPLTVQFQDLTVGSVNSWLWDLGKGAGSTSTLANPSAIYTEPGTYTITLTVNGTVTKTKTAFIEVYQSPSIDWSFQKEGICFPVDVAFQNLSAPGSGSIAKTEWLFGDGGTSSDPTPVHRYQRSGIFSVTLSVENSRGCKSIKVGEEAVAVEGVTAYFEADKEIVCQAPGVVAFTNLSSGGGILSYQWSFADGQTATENSPSHEFQSPGQYEVSVQVSSSLGCTGTATKTITIGSEKGIDFSLSESSVCINQSISLVEVATKGILSRLWDFGNGVTSGAANPTIVYDSPGTYQIKLEALLEGNQCPSVISKQVVVVNPSVPQFSSSQKCGRKVFFQGTVSNAVSYSWNFGDGSTSNSIAPNHVYASAGMYTVQFTSLNSRGCPTTITKNIFVYADPVAIVSPNEKQSCTEQSLSGCAPFVLDLESKSVSDLPLETRWQVSDGSELVGAAVTKTFSTKGVYEALLTVTNTLGCKDTAKVKIFVSDVKPNAQFEVSKTSVCVREAIHFKDISTNSNFSCWDLGSGIVSTQKEFDYSFITPGIYSVTLTSKNDGCATTLTKTNIIEVKDPFIDFSIEKNCNDPYTVRFTNLSTSYDSIGWDLGDGFKTEEETFLHTYALGNYTVKLTAGNKTTGCIVNLEKGVVIQDLVAGFDISQSSVCKDEEVSFTDKSAFAVSWVWSFSDGSTNNLQNPAKKMTQPGALSVKLRVFDSDGCSEEMEVEKAVEVIDIVGDFSFAASSTCDELHVDFQDKSTGQPEITNWLWQFGDGQLSNERNPTHAYNQTGTYGVTLTLGNAIGQCTIARDNTIIFTNPVPNFSIAKEEVCVGDPVTFTSLSINATRIAWNFGNGSTSVETKPTIHYNSAGVYTVTLTASDALGCSVDMIRSGLVKIRKPIAQFDALQTSAECPPLVTLFSNQSSPEVVKWTWDFGDGQSSILPLPSNTYRKPGVYNVSLQVEDHIGCRDTTMLQGIISVGGPSGSLQYPAEACVLDGLTFTGTTSNALVHRWDFADGLVVEGETQRDHHYKKAGVYKPVLLLIDTKGCKVPLDDGPSIVIHDIPPVDFTVEPEFPFVGETVNLKGTTSEETLLRWQWLENEWQQDALALQFEYADSVEMSLVAINPFGCRNEIKKMVRVQSDISFVPNVFTPALVDGANDTFEIRDVEKGTWDIHIYNRWGSKVYENKEYNNEWTGMDVAAGIYYYKLQNNLRPERIVKGFVHVMK